MGWLLHIKGWKFLLPLGKYLSIYFVAGIVQDAKERAWKGLEQVRF